MRMILEPMRSALIFHGEYYQKRLKCLSVQLYGHTTIGETKHVTWPVFGLFSNKIQKKKKKSGSPVTNFVE